MKLIAIVFSLFLSTWHQTLHAQRANVDISGTVEGLKDGDEIILTEFKFGRHFSFPSFKQDFRAKAVNGAFSFHIKPLGALTTVDLYIPRLQRRVFVNYFVEQGDNVYINAKKAQILFRGPSAKKYWIQDQLWKIRNFYSFDVKHSNDDFQDKYKTFLRFSDLSKEKCLDFIANQQENVPRSFSEILQGKVIIESRLERAAMLSYVFIRDSTRKLVDSISREYDVFNELATNNQKINRNTLEAVPEFSDLAIDEYLLDSVYFSGKSFDIHDCLSYLIQHYEGDFRQRVIAEMIYENRNAAANQPSDIDLALKYVHNGYYRNSIIDVKEKRVEGDYAFNFNLLDDRGIQRQLADFKGSVVLVDFWFTGCGNCRQVHPYIDSIRRIINDTAFKVVSICIDKDVNIWKRSIAEGKYSSKGDIELITMGLNNPLIRYYNISEFPTFIVVNKEGKISHPVTDPRRDQGASLLRQIQGLL